MIEAISLMLVMVSGVLRKPDTYMQPVWLSFDLMRIVRFQWEDVFF